MKSKKTLSVVLAITLVLSSLAFSFSASAATLSFGAWSTADGNMATFLRDSSDAALKTSVERSMQAEYDYQTNVLNFNLGSMVGSIKGWGQMVDIDFNGGDNVGDPWGNKNPDGTVKKTAFLLMGVNGRAFALKGYMAAHRGNDGWDSVGYPLGDEFTYNGNTYQVFTGKTTGYVTATPSTLKTVGYNVGGGSVSAPFTASNVKSNFQAAYLAISANYQNGGMPNTDLGVFSGSAIQRFVGASASKNLSGNATAAVSTNAIGADSNVYFMVQPSATSNTVYIIKDAIAAGWYVPDSIANSASRTGKPLGNQYAITGGGVRQDFEKGSMVSADGTTPAAFVSNDNTIASFAVDNGNVIVDNTAKTVKVYMPEGTDISNLVPTITLNNGATISPASGVSQNFTTPKTYTVTAQNGDVATYSVTAYNLPNNQIMSFAVQGAVSSNVDNAAGKINIVVPATTDVTALIPTISLSSPNATVTPNTGVAADFTNPVTYTVTPASGTAKTYTVTVRKQSTQNTITSFKFTAASLTYSQGSDAVAVIGGTNVTITVPYGTNLKNLTPTFAVSQYATSDKQSGTTMDFSSPVVIKVTAESGSVATYTVTVAASTTPVALPHVATADLGLGAINNVMTSFSGINNEIYAAMTNAYNKQRDLGFDLGTPTGKIENWSDVLIRQEFAGGMNKGSAVGRTAGYIMMDLPYGMAYTLKNDMLNAWTNQNGGYQNNGSPAADQFIFGGVVYQQTAFGYLTYDISANKEGGNKIGVGAVGSSFDTTTASAADWQTAEAKSALTNNFRYAYEMTNQAGYNLGVAKTDAVAKLPDVDVVFQKYSYGGVVASSAERQDTTAYIFQTGSTAKSAGAIYGQMLSLWQSGIGNGQQIVTQSVNGNDILFNKTIGAPIGNIITLANGDLVQDFANGWITVPGGNYAQATFTLGARLSNENRIKGITINGVTIVDQTFDSDQENIHVVVPYGIDISNLKVNFELFNAKETVVPASGEAYDYTFPNVLVTVTSETGVERHYYLTIDTAAADDTSSNNSSKDTDSNNNNQNPNDNNGNPSTGDNGIMMLAFIAILAGTTVVITKKRSLKNK